MGEGAAPTVGRRVAELLAAAGTDLAFTVPGESFLGLLEHLEAVGIRVVATRHEGGAGFMAAAAAHLSGRPVAALATRAVGAANLAIGLHTARSDSCPLVALIGQVRRDRSGRESFQEVDLVGTFGGLAKAAVEPRSAADASGALAAVLRDAVSGRPGPVLVSLPEDLLDEPAAGPPTPFRPADKVAPPVPRAVQAALDLLVGAERPVILAGAGVLRSGASDALAALAGALEVPVVAAWRRPDAFPNDHRLYLGMTGYWAAPTVRPRLERADAMLVLGCRLNEIASFDYTVPPPAIRWAHVDLEPRRGRGAPDVAVAADAKAFLAAAHAALAERPPDPDRLARRRAANEADRAAYLAAARVDGGTWDGPGLHPGRVVATLQHVLPPDAVLTTDAGNFSGWVQRGYRFSRPGTFLGPTSGAMGYGLPAAIAAALLRPRSAVVAVAGDGGFAMTMAELETAVREGARVVVLVFDNRRYGTIRMHQDRRADPPVATDLGPIDVAGVARALGAEGERVDADEAFEPALRRALASERAAVIHLPIDRGWVSVDERP